MKTSLSPALICLISCALSAAPPQDAVRRLAAAPLRFEPAAAGTSAQYIARGARYRFSFTATQAFFQENDKHACLQFVGATPLARLEGIDKLRSTTNVFLGNDPTRWRHAIPPYGRLHVQDLYPGINLV